MTISKHGRQIALALAVTLLPAVFALLLIATGPSAAQAGERRVALVIGNGSYQSVSPLPNPPNDATAVAETLRAVGFEIVGGKAQLNLDRAGVEQAIRTFGQALRGDAVGLFYYAGHGVQINGANYLVPVSATVTSEADVKYELVDVAFVLDEMVHAGNRLNVVILDACRNNPFGNRGMRAVTPGLAQMQAPSGTVISYATQPGNVAADGDGGHSPFTEALTTAIHAPGRTLFEVFNDIGVAVKKKTGGFQQPWLATSPIEGQFFFAPPSGEPVALVPASGAAVPGAVPVMVASADKEAMFWESIKDSQNAAFYQAYIDQFPNGVFTGLARAKLNTLPSRDTLATPAAAVPVAAPAGPAPAVAPTAPAVSPPAGGPGAAGSPTGGVPRRLFNLETVPYLSATQKAKLAPYVTAKAPKALAVGNGGHFAWMSNNKADIPAEDVRRRALERCAVLNGSPCVLYSEDDTLIDGVAEGSPTPMTAPASAATAAATTTGPAATTVTTALTPTTAAAPATGGSRLLACVRFALEEYEGGEEPSPIRGQTKAEAWCSCFIKEEPTDPGNLTTYFESRRGRSVDKKCERYADWGGD